jgi:hypothetical protein
MGGILDARDRETYGDGVAGYLEVGIEKAQ